MKAPCKDCPDRYPGCHAKCEKYIAWAAWWATVKANERRENDLWREHASHIKWRKKRTSVKQHC